MLFTRWFMFLQIFTQRMCTTHCCTYFTNYPILNLNLLASFAKLYWQAKPL